MVSIKSNSCNSPTNWFIKITILLIMIFILGGSLYYYYLNSNSKITKHHETQRV